MTQCKIIHSLHAAFVCTVSFMCVCVCVLVLCPRFVRGLDTVVQHNCDVVFLKTTYTQLPGWSLALKNMAEN